MLMLAMLAASVVNVPQSAIAPAYLRCEYLTDPIGVDAANPRLSWELRATDARMRGARQSAYRIRAASALAKLRSGRADLWDTGKVAGDQTAHIPYAGSPVASAQQVFWQVKVWDQADRESDWSAPAHWTRGPASAERRAAWIGDPASYPPAAKAHNGFHTQLADRPDVVKWVQVDLGEAKRVTGVRLCPAQPFDWHTPTPGFLFPLRFRIETALEPAGPFTAVHDTGDRDEPAAAEPRLYTFAPTTARHVRLTVTRLRERDPGNFGMALAEMEVMDGDAVVSRMATVSASGSIENGAWAAANLTDGDTSSHPAAQPNVLPPLMLRREFRLDRKPRRAVLFASALGVYEVRVNGKRVGTNVLAPEWTDYGKRVQYQGYDITPMLRKGANAIAAIVGDGWYSGRIGLFPGRGHYGLRPEFRAEIHVDGSDEPQAQTDGSWRMTLEGPIRYSDILDGEVFDARRRMSGWDLPGFDDAGWIAPSVNYHDEIALDSQPNEPISVTRELPAIGLTEPSPGVWVFDLGQNMVGWARLRVQAPEGTALRLRFAEMLNDDGSVYTANLRGAPQTDHYICSGKGVEYFEPTFTYHGFRYVEVTGLPAPARVGDLVGRVFHSASPEVGTFACSDPDLNRLWQNIVWTQRANLMSTPTDCPQRDERLGWMGDIQAFGPTACFNMDLAAFFTKWLQDVRDAQADDGRFPDFAPNPGDSNKRFSGVPAWGDAGVIIPWLVYTTYGDKALLERHYPSCRRWIEWILGNNPDLIWANARNADYNDWLNGDTLIAEGWPTKGGEVPKEVFATAFWAHSTRLTGLMAEALGLKADAERYRKLFESIRDAFVAKFVSADGKILGDTQAGYALALHFDLVPESLRPAVVERMVAAIEAYGWRISTGIQSTHRMMLELTRAGRSDVAYRLMMNRSFPSWLYSVANGATTIWERWDGYVKGRGFQNPGMNSFNHWALGAVAQWMVETMLGLRPDPAAIGWKRFVVAPEPGGGISHVEGSYRAMPGLIKVAWKVADGRFTLDLEVPPNTEARVCMPAADIADVFDGRRPATGSDGIRLHGSQSGKVVLSVEPGIYRLSCPFVQPAP